MPRLKLSPSAIESFRKGRLFNRTNEELIEGLTGEFRGNDYTSIGSAFGSVLQFGETVGNWDDEETLFEVYEGEQSKLWAFDAAAMEAAHAFRQFYKPLSYEVRGELEYESLGHQVYSPLRVDAVQGATIHEFKTTTSSHTPSFEDFERSVQWRAYLLAFPNAQRVIYTVFHFKRSKADERFVGLKALHQFAFSRCEGLLDYLKIETAELARFAHTHNLIEQLQHNA